MKFFNLVAILFSLISPQAFAAKETAASPNKSICDEEECRSYMDWARQWSWSIGPRYILQNNDRADAAFSTNGFQSPKKSLMGLNFELLRHCDNGWSLGLGLSWFGSRRESANFEANYRGSLVGLKTGYDFLYGNPESSLVLGSDLGLAGTQLEVFSSIKDGRRNSASFYVEPNLTYYHRIADRVRLGLRASYLATIGESSDSKGDNLGVTQVAPRGISAALLLNLGRFGEK